MRREHKRVMVPKEEEIMNTKIWIYVVHLSLLKGVL
jgi:hypothetical protein